jgi:hypothetical protein
MKLLSEALADDADFFVEQVQITAIVFDNTDDVTVWATTFFDEAPHFFHLGLTFSALDTLLRVAHGRAEVLQEEVADALATTEEWPCLLEYTTEERPPVQLPGVALKLAVTYPADEEGSEEEESEEEEGEDDPIPHNVFYLEGVFVKVD